MSTSDAARLAELECEAVGFPHRITIDTTTRTELDERGEAIHPGTGLLLKRDKGSGEMTATDRSTGAVYAVAASGEVTAR
jgi:hypothetical protein